MNQDREDILTRKRYELGVRSEGEQIQFLVDEAVGLNGNRVIGLHRNRWEKRGVYGQLRGKGNDIVDARILKSGEDIESLVPDQVTVETEYEGGLFGKTPVVYTNCITRDTISVGPESRYWDPEIIGQVLKTAYTERGITDQAKVAYGMVYLELLQQKLIEDSASSTQPPGRR